MARKNAKGSWVVEVKAVVRRFLIVNDCTREQAEKEPYEQEVVDERDEDTIDFEVVSVTPYEA